MYFHLNCMYMNTLGKGWKSVPSHNNTARIIAEETKPMSWVFPALLWMSERERLPAAVNELKNEPMMFIAPYAMNSCEEKGREGGRERGRKGEREGGRDSM